MGEAPERSRATSASSSAPHPQEGAGGQGVHGRGLGRGRGVLWCVWGFGQSGGRKEPRSEACHCPPLPPPCTPFYPPGAPLSLLARIFTAARCTLWPPPSAPAAAPWRPPWLRPPSAAAGVVSFLTEESGASERRRRDFVLSRRVRSLGARTGPRAIWTTSLQRASSPLLRHAGLRPSPRAFLPRALPSFSTPPSFFFPLSPFLSGPRTFASATTNDLLPQPALKGLSPYRGGGGGRSSVS